MSAELPLPHARDAEAAAADWLAHLDREGLLDSEQDLDALCEHDQAFAAWIKESTANRVAFLRLLGAWQRSERLAALRNGDPAPRRSLVRRPLVQALAAAACLAIAVIGAGAMGLFATAPEGPAPIRYHTAHGEIRTVDLADGSVLTLNTDTSLSVSFTDETRRVDLYKGEAYFDVASAPERPFRIDAGDGRVEVLGTAFGIERRDSGMEVAVSEGTVWFSAAVGEKSSANVLNAGMIGYASPDGLIVERSGAQTVESRLLWREGRLRFDDTPLREVAAEFNRYNSTQLVIADEVTGEVEIGGTFPVDNVEAFARLAEDGLGLKVRRKAGRIELSGS